MRTSLPLTLAVAALLAAVAAPALAQAPAAPTAPTAPGPAAAPATPPPATRQLVTTPPTTLPPPAPGGPGVTVPAAALERVTFAEAVRRAVLSATSAVIAAAEIRRAEGLLWQVRSASLPFLGGTASYTVLDAARTAPGSTTPLVARDSLNANLALQVPLVAASRWTAWAHASEQVDVARASEADVRRGAALTAARAYLAILAQKRLIAVSTSSRDIAKIRYDFAHARRTGGIGNAVDELRAEQQLAASEVILSAGEVNLTLAREALGALTGGEAPLDAAEEPDFTVAPVPDALAAADQRRADVQAARVRLGAAEHVVRDSWADWLPTLFATAQPFYNDPATITSPQTGWQVQFVLSVPIFEGGLRLGQIDERRAVADESKAFLEGTLRQARSEVRAAVDAVTRREGALAQARISAERARSALQLVAEAYRAGATNDLDVSTAQQQARDADLAAVVAEDNVRQARLDLLAAIGQFP